MRVVVVLSWLSACSASCDRHLRLFVIAQPTNAARPRREAWHCRQRESFYLHGECAFVQLLSGMGWENVLVSFAFTSLFCRARWGQAAALLGSLPLFFLFFLFSLLFLFLFFLSFFFFCFIFSILIIMYCYCPRLLYLLLIIVLSL